MDFFKIKEPTRGTLDLKSGSENGTPQRRTISPISFSIMINDIFGNVSFSHIVNKFHEGINQVEMWGRNVVLGFQSKDKSHVFHKEERQYLLKTI